MKEIIKTPHAPAAIGPYNQAIKANGLIFCSGQIPLDPLSGGGLAPGGIEIQTHQVIKNLKAVLEAAGSSLDKIVKTTVYLADMGEFEAMNSIYGEYFDENAPARATVEVSCLPKNVAVEIDCIALA